MSVILSSISRLHHFLSSHLPGTTAERAVSAFMSLAWYWPIRGLAVTVMHPRVMLQRPVRGALLKSLASSALLFALLAFFAYTPQAALISRTTAFFLRLISSYTVVSHAQSAALQPLITRVFTLFLLGAEALWLFHAFRVLATSTGRPLALDLEGALQRVFDATLVDNGHRRLVDNGARSAAASMADRSGSSAPFEPLPLSGSVDWWYYLLTLPLNIVPILGSVWFVCVNGERAGPGWHARYFGLKRYDEYQRGVWAQRRRVEYAAFGTSALILNVIPVLGPSILTFTNTVGAALWAANIETKAGVIERGLNGMLRESGMDSDNVEEVIAGLWDRNGDSRDAHGRGRSDELR